MRSRAIGLILLLGLGALLVHPAMRPLLKGEVRNLDPFTVIVILAAIVAMWSGALRQRVHQGLEWLRAVTPWKMATSLFIAALALLIYSIWWQAPYLGPASHDEHSYLLQTLMLASGRLWTASPISPDSFESFFILTRPVYGSMYPPGTALMHVPGVWLHIPQWAVSLVINAAAIPAGYLVLRRALGGDMALVAAVLLMGAPQARSQGPLLISHLPTLTLGLTALALAVRYRERQTVSLAAALGAVIGLVLITRPQDGAGYLLAVAWLLWPLWRALCWRHLIVGVAAAMPFLTLAVVQNVGMTGSAFKTAFWTYTQTNQPGTGFFTHTASTRPATLLQQKVDYNETFGGEARADRERGMVQSLVVSRIPKMLQATLASATLAALIPLGILGLWGRSGDREGKALFVLLAWFFAVYGLFTFFLSHYPVPYTFIFTSIVAASAAGVARLAPTLERAARVGVFILAVGMTLAAIPGVNPRATDASMLVTDVALVQKVSDELPIKPALLLVRYQTGDPFHQEPVYNVQDWRLEGNQVLRAHDLGPEVNQRLFKGLAQQEKVPRMVYLFIRRTRELIPLGRVDELAATP